ncbi:Density-regulated protein [Trichinella pseudospiralis]|uniref:Density-regulated protein n=1 Tax=Trichinella pseudospiralis TaxID=6337 RepID=A0A0V1ETL1_TRIPS|nr:Density-regulated protein [Trichinella pseudospiralis]KRY77178.1 Density-regulated protein [Trichinella pseudospiralis]KRZ33429.1 Density-regulated protein [Trichinella pseudospiralis]KRZ41250.1 Density-regulated protein [Trichinella pseudospiralis]
MEKSSSSICTVESGPNSNVHYPVKVNYCGECSMPVEYCDYGPCPEKCREWLRDHLPKSFEEMTVQNTDSDATTLSEEKKRQKRGGKGMAKAKKNTSAQPVTLATSSRGKNKFVTIVSGLSSYNINLKVASKVFSQKFACGSSVTGDDEIVIQGDVKDDLMDLISEKWPQIEQDAIEDIGEAKR